MQGFNYLPSPDFFKGVCNTNYELMHCLTSSELRTAHLDTTNKELQQQVAHLKSEVRFVTSFCFECFCVIDLNSHRDSPQVDATNKRKREDGRQQVMAQLEKAQQQMATDADSLKQVLAQVQLARDEKTAAVEQQQVLQDQLQTCRKQLTDDAEALQAVRDELRSSQEKLTASAQSIESQRASYEQQHAASLQKISLLEQQMQSSKDSGELQREIDDLKRKYEVKVCQLTDSESSVTSLEERVKKMSKNLARFG